MDIIAGDAILADEIGVEISNFVDASQATAIAGAVGTTEAMGNFPQWCLLLLKYTPLSVQIREKGAGARNDGRKCIKMPTRPAVDTVRAFA